VEPKALPELFNEKINRQQKSQRPGGAGLTDKDIDAK
jgi:hypothetical protein